MKEQTCAKCGKVFIPSYYHIYKDSTRFYCSWTCYNHKEDKQKGDVQAKRRNKRVELWSMSGSEVLRVFKNAEDASRQTGFNAADIREACHTGEPYRGFVWMYRE